MSYFVHLSIHDPQELTSGFPPRPRTLTSLQATHRVLPKSHDFGVSQKPEELPLITVVLDALYTYSIRYLL